MKLVDVRPNTAAEYTLNRNTGPLVLPGGGGSLYGLSDGRWLHLPAAAAAVVADLKLGPGDSFRCALYLDGPTGPYWSIWRGAGGARRGAPAENPQLTLPGMDRPCGARGAIPMNIAFREITGFVRDELNAAGQTWGDRAVQDLVSTVFIAAGRAGWLMPWERTG